MPIGFSQSADPAGLILLQRQVDMLPLIILAAFVAVPIAEIATFIQIGSLVGLWPTLAGVVVTAVAGAWLVRQQGFAVMSEAQAAIGRNEAPVDAAIHGFFLLIAGLLLLTPGFLTDAVGFALLCPPVRRLAARHGWRWMQQRMSSSVHRPGQSGHNDGPVIDGEAVDITPAGSPPGEPSDDTPWRGPPARTN